MSENTWFFDAVGVRDEQTPEARRSTGERWIARAKMAGRNALVALGIATGFSAVAGVAGVAAASGVETVAESQAAMLGAPRAQDGTPIVDRTGTTTMTETQSALKD